LRVPVSRCIVQKEDDLGEILSTFPSKCLSVARAKMNNTPC
jgi:hypothetical protein